jgi:putative transposase
MRYRRLENAGGYYFFTVVTEGRRPILVDEIERLKRAFRVTRERHPFVMDALVVLPDHLHTIWRLPEGDRDTGLRWRVLKRLFSAGLPARRVSMSQVMKGEKGIWQRRFWERCIVSHADWLRHMEYIHFNPVKHGYCRLPGEWPYSTFARAVAGGVHPMDLGKGPTLTLGQGEPA